MRSASNATAAGTIFPARSERARGVASWLGSGLGLGLGLGLASPSPNRDPDPDPNRTLTLTLAPGQGGGVLRCISHLRSHDLGQRDVRRPKRLVRVRG